MSRKFIFTITDLEGGTVTKLDAEGSSGAIAALHVVQQLLTAEIHAMREQMESLGEEQ